MGFFIILPVMTGQNIPLMARISLCLGLAMLAFTANAVILPDYVFSIMGFGMLLVQEFAIGLILGFVVMIFFSMFHFIGQLVDYQMGFSMVTVFDPFGQLQTPITGNLFYLLVSVFFIYTGLLHHVIFIFFETFTILGMGEAIVLGNYQIPRLAIAMIVEYFAFGLRVAIPFIGTLVTIDVVLGILVKAVPQMNVFVVGLPLKVFVGLILLFLLMPMLADAFTYVANQLAGHLIEITRAMIPLE